MNAPQPAAAFSSATTASNEPLYHIPTATLLSRGLILLCVALALFFSSASGVLYDMRSITRTILKDAAPSIVAAQQIKTSMANIDANAVNAALLRGSAADAAWKELETEQRILSDYLVTSSQNITYGDDEKGPLVEIVASLQVYSDLIGQARTAIADSQAAKASAGVTDAATLDLLSRAAEIMNARMIPAANALNAANETILDATWTSRNSHKIHDYIVILCASTLVLIVLVTTQILVSKRTNRRINPGMLAATVVFIGGFLFVSSGVISSNYHLHVAKEDAFDSVRSLWKVRALAYSMNADESYYLLDPKHKDRHFADFSKKLELLTGNGFSDQNAMNNYISVSNAMLESKCKNRPQGGSSATPGLIGEELLNVTFDYECQEAVNLVPTLAEYVKTDSIIRKFEETGLHSSALSLALGDQPGQSNYLFGKFNQELGLLIYLNQMAFEDNAKKSTGSFDILEIILAGVSLLTLALTFIGLRPRLAEYRQS